MFSSTMVVVFFMKICYKFSYVSVRQEERRAAGMEFIFPSQGVFKAISILNTCNPGVL